MGKMQRYVRLAVAAAVSLQPKQSGDTLNAAYAFDGAHWAHAAKGAENVRPGTPLAKRYSGPHAPVPSDLAWVYLDSRSR